jgi:hypothetical protein
MYTFIFNKIRFGRHFGRFFHKLHLITLSGMPEVWRRQCTHRNLTWCIEILLLEQVCMFALVLQTFWAKITRKKYAGIHPRQGNLLHTNILQGSTKPLFTTQNRLEIS